MTICTLTLSPALDIEYRTKSVALGLNRTREHRVSAGGKGINVSRAILACAKDDGMDIPFALRTVAPLGGHVGRMISSILESEGIPVTAVPIAGNTRTNVSLIPDEGDSLEINAPGTPLGDGLSRIEEAVFEGLGAGDVLMIAGSCPSDVPKSCPAELVKKAKYLGITAVLDCDGEALKIAVTSDAPPDLIKPNREELAALCGLSPDCGTEDLCRAAEGLAVPNVITTMAGEGSMLTRTGASGKRVTERFPTEARPVVRLKGAGDTYLGAFVYAYWVRREGPGAAMRFAAQVAGNYVAGN
ncbi:MAG: hypothetical protein II768_10960 [Clostridia bacterium]|nr:hypothetical protein [Clostridia bacterium]